MFHTDLYSSARGPVIAGVVLTVAMAWPWTLPDDFVGPVAPPAFERPYAIAGTRQLSDAQPIRLETFATFVAQPGEILNLLAPTNPRSTVRITWTDDAGTTTINLPAWQPADFNLDGFVDGIDADTFSNLFEAGDPKADYNRDGVVDGIDADTFSNAFAGS